MTTSTPPVPCPVVWPIEHSPEELAVMVGDSLIAQYARPRHTCKLPAAHVHWPIGTGYVDEHGAPIVKAEPHRCHCGAWIPVAVEADAAVQS